MKKTLAVLLVTAFIITLFSGCASKNDTIATTNTTSTTATTTTTEPTTVKSNPIDYLPTGFEARDIVKAYFEEHGYTFDSWNVTSDNNDEYISLKPGSSPVNSGGGIIARNGYLMFNLGTSSTNAVVMSTETEYDTAVLDVMISDSSLDAYEILDLLFADCPDDVKPPTSTFREKNQQNPNTFNDIEINGLYYRVSEYTNAKTPITMLGVYRNEPGGWKG